MNCALGEKIEMVSIAGAPDRTSGTCKVKPSDGSAIPCLTIDSLPLTSCDFIQLDVEGYEPKILAGAKNTIEKFRPVIAAENGKRGVVLDFLKDLDYDFVDQSVSDSIWIPKGV